MLGPNINVFFEKAQQYNIDPLVAAAVIKAESGGNPNAVHVNKNGTKDFSYFQINSIHLEEAMKRGDDITTPEGNLDFGFYLASREGFHPWSASEQEWGKILNNLAN